MRPTYVTHRITGEVFLLVSNTEWEHRQDGTVSGIGGLDLDGDIQVRDTHGETRWFSTDMIDPVPETV